MPATGFRFGAAPDVEAIRYFASKGLRTSFDYRDVFGLQHAEAFTVAKATSLDVLDSIGQDILRVIKEGQTLRDFQRNLTPRLQALGWWGRRNEVDPVTGAVVDAQLGSPRRLKTIYDVNVRSARAAGQWHRVERTKKARPYLMYRLGPSEVHRPEHAAWAQIILPVDHPFWTTHMPINGYGCKCWVRQISAAEMKRRGWKVTQAPEVAYRNWHNKRTGQTLRVPQGIDPGFDINWGKQRTESNARLLVQKLHAARTDVTQAAIRELVDSDQFEQWVALDAPQGWFPVTVMPDNIVEALNAKSRVAVLSGDTLRKQARRHPEISVDDYRDIGSMLHADTVIEQRASNLIVVHSTLRVRNDTTPTKHYRIALKAATGGPETFVVSVTKTTMQEINRIRRRLERKK